MKEYGFLDSWAKVEEKAWVPDYRYRISDMVKDVESKERLERIKLIVEEEK